MRQFALPTTANLSLAIRLCTPRTCVDARLREQAGGYNIYNYART